MCVSVLTNSRSMSKWLKPLCFGIWGLLLIPLIATTLEKWLEENFFSDPNAVATTVFNNLLALSQQRWFKFALVFLTGIVIGVSLEWLARKSDEKKLPSSEAWVLNFAVFPIASKLGPHRQDGRTAILDLQSSLHLSPPRNLICGYPVSACINCRMRHSFVNTSDVSEGF